MRLTKSRLKALDHALSIDDVLYEKFKRENERLQQEWHKLYRTKHVVRVLQKQGNIYHALQIQDIHIGPEGTTVICA